jgi:hypothetical protein
MFKKIKDAISDFLSGTLGCLFIIFLFIILPIMVVSSFDWIKSIVVEPPTKVEQISNLKKVIRSIDQNIDEFEDQIDVFKTAEKKLFLDWFRLERKQQRGFSKEVDDERTEIIENIENLLNEIKEFERELLRLQRQKVEIQKQILLLEK